MRSKGKRMRTSTGGKRGRAGLKLSERRRRRHEQKKLASMPNAG